jgi:hypothetical protein
VPTLENDRYLAPDIAAAIALVRHDQLRAIAAIHLPIIDPEGPPA